MVTKTVLIGIYILNIDRKRMTPQKYIAKLFDFMLNEAAKVKRLKITTPPKTF